MEKYSIYAVSGVFMDKAEIIKDLENQGCTEIDVRNNGKTFLIKFKTAKEKK